MVLGAATIKGRLLFKGGYKLRLYGMLIVEPFFHSIFNPMRMFNLILITYGIFIFMKLTIRKIIDPMMNYLVGN